MLNLVLELESGFLNVVWSWNQNGNGIGGLLAGIVIGIMMYPESCITVVHVAFLFSKPIFPLVNFIDQIQRAMNSPLGAVI